MHSPEIELRQYLVDIDSDQASQVFTDVLVVGVGIAGLRAALEAARSCNVMLVCKDSIEDSNTWNAQGGIASVLGGDDSFESHIEDTLRTGVGLNDRQVVSLVVQQGPGLVRQLIDWGIRFDTVGDQIDICVEGGHSHARIAHAHGDSTGRAIVETLIEQIKQQPRIQVMENFFALDLITDPAASTPERDPAEAGRPAKARCLGMVGTKAGANRQIIWAGSTILATGGAGQLYRETTNPLGATADGLAMAWRTGAVLRDLEFMQFHPTTLYIAGASRALVTETLRGEGAVLLDCNNYRFMKDYHPAAELAPRDVVSRAILAQMLKTGSTHVYLDVRSLDKEHFAKRFPLISELCRSFDIDVSRDLVPVRPSAHYMIGGLKTDKNGCTTIDNLYACGEVASTGLHGANRLGSNSLLEGLVFGRTAGCQAASAAKVRGKSRQVGTMMPLKHHIPHSDRSRLDTADVRNSLRALMWRNVGIIRWAKPLAEAQEIIRFWMRYVMDKVFDGPEGWECQNMLTVALLMAQAAERRCESRGVHYRQDYPDTNDKNFLEHIELLRGSS